MLENEEYKNLPVLFFETAEAWRAWLTDHHTDEAGVWLKFAKKTSGIESLNYAAALQEALCFGWIDGQAQSIDETYYLQKFTKRRPQSMWSKRNVGYVTALIEAGKMQPSGLAAIEAAKADGRWENAYDSSSAITIPDDFKEALGKHPKADEFYKTLNKTNTYAILWRIQTAKRPETRAARIAKFITMLEEGKKIH
jgi:uncharacterized protein YdeI (YjbR/CyaY-like superfamily)